MNQYNSPMWVDIKEKFIQCHSWPSSWNGLLTPLREIRPLLYMYSNLVEESKSV